MSQKFVPTAPSSVLPAHDSTMNSDWQENDKFSGRIHGAEATMNDIPENRCILVGLTLFIHLMFMSRRDYQRIMAIRRRRRRVVSQAHYCIDLKEQLRGSMADMLASSAVTLISIFSLVFQLFKSFPSCHTHSAI